MNPKRWQTLDALIRATLECEPAEREMFIAIVCGNDGELRRELECMIAQHEKDQTLIEQPTSAIRADMPIEEITEKLIGTSRGSYRVLSRLGVGGMGEVYLALDTELQRKVALKFLHRDLTGVKQKVQRFKQEARAASALNHPNILTIYEIGETDGRQFIAAEFVEGDNLRILMKRGRMTLQKILDIAIQTASALTAAHAAGIVHRDVKPENIMVRPDGYLKLVDFGIAKLIERRLGNKNAATLSETENNAVLGTVSYMSPEQIRAGSVDARTDIWSFGVMLYELLTGRLPFGGETAGDLIAGVLTSEPTSVSTIVKDLPADLQRIINR